MLSEHRFWLQNLGDHARLLFFAAAPNESGEIGRLRTFILEFDGLFGELKRPDPGDFDRRAREKTRIFRDYQLELLALSLSGGLNLQLSSSFISRMVSEAEEYISLLDYAREGRPPLFFPIRYLLVWLPAAAADAGLILSRLDPAETDMIGQVRDFETRFRSLSYQALEMSGFMRARLNRFPALDRLCAQTERLTASFLELLGLLKGLKADGSLLGGLSAFDLEHIARETAYGSACLSRAVGNMAD